MAKILCIGSALQDIYLIDRDDFIGTRIGSETIYGQISIGGKVEIDRIAYEIGGGAVNSATTLARHDHEVCILSAIGNDIAGQAILAHLDEENIDSSEIIISRGSTGCSVILLDSRSGERTALTYRGVTNSTSYGTDAVQNFRPDWIYVSATGGQLGPLTRIFSAAKSFGTRIMFNPGKKELEHPQELLKLVSMADILLLNRREAASLVPGASLTELLERLLKYCGSVIITDGAMGGIASDSVNAYRFGIYSDVKVKDSTGAGDAFGAGFLAHFAAGHPFRSSLIFASANSTSVVSRIGANRGALTGRESLHPMLIQKL